MSETSCRWCGGNAENGWFVHFSPTECIEARNKRIAALESELVGRDEQIKVKQACIRSYGAIIEKQKTQLAARDEIIKGLREALELAIDIYGYKGTLEDAAKKHGIIENSNLRIWYEVQERLRAALAAEVNV